MKIVFLILSMLMVGCASQKKFTDGAYNNPREVRLLDDKFNEADMQQITQTMVTSLMNCSKVSESNPTVIIGDVNNQTSEHLNLDAVMDQIQNQLVNSHKFILVDRPVRSQAEAEYDYQKNKNIYQEDVPVKAKYILHGAISSNVQEFADHKLVYYKMNLKLTNLQNTMVVCSEEKELRKEFSKKSSN